MTSTDSSGAGPSSSAFRLGDRLVDLTDYTVGEEVLTEQEVSLLEQLYAAGGKPVTRLALYREVWGYRVEPRGRALDFAIRRVRIKLGDDSRKPRFLLTVRGVGFKLVGVEALTADESSSVHSLPVVVPPSRPASSALLAMRPANRFVGREAERDELTELLADQARMITLLGPGGVGKTRLAVEVLVDKPCSVATADLSEVDAGGSPVAVLAAALDPRTESPTTRALVRAASRARVDILFIDRCEHVAASLGPILTELVQSSSLTILATSRHRLGVTGEVLFDVSPLSAGDAAVLLVERTRSMRRRMRVRPNDPVIRRLVQRVEGLPMAIELTAARLRASSPHQIERRLQESFTTLQSSQATSLLQTIQWSWDLLSTPHQQALSALHLIGTVISPEQAEAVLAPLGDPHALLEALVDRSWLQPSIDEPFRYRLLSPAVEWLEQHAPEPSAEIMGAFIGLYATFAQEPPATGISHKAFARAVDFALAVEHAALLDIAHAFVRHSAPGHELNGLVERIDRVQSVLPTMSVELEYRLYWRLLRDGQHERTHERMSQRIEVAELSPTQQAERHWLLARVYKNIGRLDDAIEEADTATRAAKQAKAWTIGAGICSLQVELYSQRGDLTAAMDAGREALAIADRIASSGGGQARIRYIASTAANRLAPLYLMDGDVVTARRLMDERLVRQREIGRAVPIHGSMASLALLELMVGETERCASLVADAMTLETTDEIHFSKIQLRVVRTYLHLMAAEIPQARTAAKAAIKLAEAHEVQARAVSLLALAMVDLNDNKSSSEALGRCMQICDDAGLRLVGCQAAGVGAWLAARRGADSATLVELASKAESLAAFDGIADEQIAAYAGAAVGYSAAGQPADAIRAMERATELSRSLAHLVFMTYLVPMARAEIGRMKGDASVIELPPGAASEA